MPPLEKFILHRLHELDGQVRAAYEIPLPGRRPSGAGVLPGDLSALYFDIRKDALYCDRPDALRRRAARTVMDEVFMRLTAWLAPLTPFTMEEAWTDALPRRRVPTALRVIPDTPAEWRNPAEAERWAAINTVLEVVNESLEAARREKLIGGALDAWPTVTAPASDVSSPQRGEGDREAVEGFLTSHRRRDALKSPSVSPLRFEPPPHEWGGDDAQPSQCRWSIPSDFNRLPIYVPRLPSKGSNGPIMHPSRRMEGSPGLRPCGGESGGNGGDGEIPSRRRG
jgi:hypothetical protein